VAALTWRLDPARICASTGPLGGGVGRRDGIVNLQVASGYAGLDPAADLRAALPPGMARPVGMMTAAAVDQVKVAQAGRARAWATVGLSHPRRAAATPSSPRLSGHPPPAGTVNIVVLVERRVSQAALLNLLTTATEAKCQALYDAGVSGEEGDGPATGTATDAVCIGVLADGPVEPFGGPLSPAGGDVAEAVFAAVVAGARAWKAGTAGVAAVREDVAWSR
jgi:adenosylcobinamide amidohydrolase